MANTEKTLYECPACGRQLRGEPGREGSSCTCPACGQVVELPLPLELIGPLENQSPTSQNQIAQWLWKPSRQPFTVFFGIVIVLLIALFISDRIAQRLPERPVKVQINDWILTCQVTHRGDARADEAFSAAFLEKLAFEQGVRVDRTYPGTRVSARVTVGGSQAGGPVEPGNYTLYGTVTEIDVLDKRLNLTDCVFAPVGER